MGRLSSEDLGVLSGDRSERLFETGCKGMMQNIGFSTWQTCCIRVLPKARVKWTKSALNKVTKNSGVNRVEVHEIPPTAMELLGRRVNFLPGFLTSHTHYTNELIVFFKGGGEREVRVVYWNHWRRENRLDLIFKMYTYMNLSNNRLN